MKIILKSTPFIMALLAIAAIYAGCTKGPDIKTYTYPAPQPQGISPNSGYPGSYLTINGASFGDYTSVVKVYFNGILADTVISCEDGKIIVMVPSTALSGKVSLQVWGNTVDSIGSFTVWPPLTIKTTDVLGGVIGDTLKIYGSGLGNDLSKIKIKFNGADATVASVTDTVITTTVPSGAADGNLTVSVNDSTMAGPSFKLLSLVGDPIYWLQFEGNLADKMGKAAATYTFKAPEGKDMGYSKGQVGQAVKFQGTYNLLTTNNQFMSLPKDITKQKELTVACWVNWTNDSTTWTQEPIFDAGAARGTRLCLMTRMSTGFGTGYQNMISRLAFENVKDPADPTGKTLLFGTPPTYFNVIGKPLTKKEWHHVAMVVSQANQIERIYMDGVEVGSTALTPTADQTIYTHSKVYIGAPTNGNTKEPALGGMVDEFQIFDQVLTSNQIFSIYFKTK